MTCAYNEIYLDDAMRNLGEAFDYVSNACQIELDLFMDMFITSDLARQFGVGVPGVICGRSGTELVREVLERTGIKDALPKAQVDYGCSVEYWCGWVLAYYQWYTGRSFQDIRRHFSMQELVKLYPTLHEAAEEKFVDTLNAMIRRQNLPVRLQELRKLAGYTQRQLAEKSGVNLRNIQQYEQRVKDINKASGEHLWALARVLGCRMEDLMEYEVRDAGVEVPAETCAGDDRVAYELEGQECFVAEMSADEVYRV